MHLRAEIRCQKIRLAYLRWDHESKKIFIIPDTIYCQKLLWSLSDSKTLKHILLTHVANEAVWQGQKTFLYFQENADITCWGNLNKPCSVDSTALSFSQMEMGC